MQRAARQIVGIDAGLESVRSLQPVDDEIRGSVLFSSCVQERPKVRNAVLKVGAVLKRPFRGIKPRLEVADDLLDRRAGLCVLTEFGNN